MSMSFLPKSPQSGGENQDQQGSHATPAWLKSLVQE
jgi:hypothetical protein